MKTIEQMAAQGDVLIRRINELPEGVMEAKAEGDHYIVAHSETGHHHVIERGKALMFNLPDDIYRCFIVAKEPVDLVHERSFDTHEPLRLPEGTYEIRRQREYTPEGYRRAAD